MAASKTKKPRGLTEKQRRFVEAYMGEAAGNAGKAYRLAGYQASTDTAAYSAAYKLLRNAQVQRAIDDLVGADPLVAGRVEVQRFWSEVMRGKKGQRAIPTGEGVEIVNIEADFKERVRASELLAKTQGQFIERVEHSGPDGGAIPLGDVLKQWGLSDGEKADDTGGEAQRTRRRRTCCSPSGCTCASSSKLQARASLTARRRPRSRSSAAPAAKSQSVR